MSGTELILLEIGGAITTSALKGYMDHRKLLIAENRGDELLSSRIKKYIYSKNMEPNIIENDDEIPHTTARPGNTVVDISGNSSDCESVYPYPDEKSDDSDTDLKTIATKVIEALPPMKREYKRKSLMGFNPEKIKKFVVDTARSLTPQKLKVVEKETPPEFDKFVRKMLVFIKNEMIIQEDTDCTILEQKHYTAKLMRSLCVQTKNEK